MSNCSCGGNGRRCCENCPPCDNAIPESCEYLEVVSEAQRVIVEDEQGCKKTLANAADPALIQDNGDGTITANTGAVGDEINLSALQTQVSGESTLVGQQADGDLAKILPTNDGEDYLHVSTGTTGEFVDKNELYGTGGGVLVQDGTGPSADDIALQDGTDGQVLAMVSGNARFTNPSGLFQTASIPASNLQAFNNANVIGITAAELVVLDGSGSYVQLSNITVNVTRTISGLNGLDVGSLSTYTIYWVYVIYNPSTLSVGGVISLSQSNPTLPAGYTHYRKVSAVCTLGTTSLYPGMAQSGNILVLNPAGTPGAGVFALFARTADYTSASGSLTLNLPVSPLYASRYLCTTDYGFTSSGTLAVRTSVTSTIDSIQLFASLGTNITTATSAVQTYDNAWISAAPGTTALTFNMNGSSWGTGGTSAFMIRGYEFNFI